VGFCRKQELSTPALSPYAWDQLSYFEVDLYSSLGASRHLCLPTFHSWILFPDATVLRAIKSNRAEVLGPRNF
jgi:hypothetical protein